MHWNILENLWKRTQETSNVSTANDTQTWDLEMKTLYELGVGMEDAIQFLYFQKPDFEAFKNWIKTKKADQNDEIESEIDNVLSEQDLKFWNKNGYVILKNAISKQDCEATQKAIWDFLKMDPEKPETWYKRHENQKGLMLHFSDHETLNKNRSSLKIKKAYEQLYNTTQIYKVIDKVSFNPPETSRFTF